MKLSAREDTAIAVEAPRIPAAPRLRGAGGPRDVEMDQAVRRGSLARAFYRFLEYLSRLVGILLYDIRSFGSHAVPLKGAAVVASNHQSYLDPWLVGMCLRRPVFYLARDDLFGWRGFAAFLRGLNALPIPRSGPASRRGIELARAVLRAREALIVFPEGTRTRNGRMGPVKGGVGLIAGPSGAPVIPVFVDGSFESWPPQRRLPRPSAVRVFFGRPLAVEGEQDPVDSSADRPASGRGSREGTSADLVARLSAAYRSLEAQARQVRWAGAAGASWRPHFRWSFF